MLDDLRDGAIRLDLGEALLGRDVYDGADFGYDAEGDLRLGVAKLQRFLEPVGLSSEGCELLMQLGEGGREAAQCERPVSSSAKARRQQRPRADSRRPDRPRLVLAPQAFREFGRGSTHHLFLLVRCGRPERLGQLRSPLFRQRPLNQRLLVNRRLDGLRQLSVVRQPAQQPTNRHLLILAALLLQAIL